MLSRVAENIYWLARYIERAENTARLIRVNTQLVLDTPRGVSPGWEPLVLITGSSETFFENYSEANERNVVRFLIASRNNHGSILSSLIAARENLRTVREVLPRSTWEALNEIYLYALTNADQGVTKKGRDDFLDYIIDGSRLIGGMINSIMYRDSAYHFLRIGRNLERADMTTRIIDVRSTDLFEVEDQLETRSLDTLQWISVLKSLSCYQSYRRQVQIRISRRAVLEYLFKQKAFPRSVAHNLAAVDDSLRQLPASRKLVEQIRELETLVIEVDTSAISKKQLHEKIDEIQLGIIHMHNALADRYFARHHQQLGD